MAVSSEPHDFELIGGFEKRKITIVSYQSSWPRKFQEHADIITQALDHALLQVEHIGSTSVPGLGAKPVIDILAVVNNSGNEASYLSQLQKAGYELRVREPDWYEHRMLRTPEKDVHIHVFSLGCPEIERYLLFRDRLRNHPEERDRYESVKRQLAARDWPDMNFYAEAKTEVVEQIIDAARAEKMRGQKTKKT